jgi:hypothetical protein
MASTPQQRLAVIAAAYNEANDHRDQDIADAQDDRQYQQIVGNLRTLEGAFLDTAAEALQASGEAVEAAYRSATGAAEAVQQAYASGKEIAERIRAVAAAAAAVTQLIEIAAAL